MSPRQVLLDPREDNVPPPGYAIAEDPVSFLEYSLDGGPLYVRGENLCRWADDLAVGRQWCTTWLKSPADELVEQCPELTREEARALLGGVGTRFAELRRPLELRDVLDAVYGEAGLWSGRLDLEHAFWWLVWLSQQVSTGPQMKLARQQARAWELKAAAQLRAAYSATSSTDAWSRIKEWLKVTETKQQWPPTPSFPLRDSLSQRLQSDLTKEAVATDTDFFIALLNRAPHRDLLVNAAMACAEVLTRNPKKATADRRRRLERYLSYDAIQKINDLVEPADPGLPEWDFDHLQSWFTRAYMPYREWTYRHRARRGPQGWVADHAENFARGYLQYYSDARVGADGAAYLAWTKTSLLMTERTGQVRLLVILDGLTYPDALRFRSQIQKEARRLFLDRETIALAPLPTVTEFAKPAVAKGMLPANALADIGRRVLTSPDAAAQAAERAARGDVLVWTLQEPDKTYHFRADAGPMTARSEADAQLNAIAQNIATIVEKVPNDLSLRVVITTDHGRLLDTAKRTRLIPEGMKPHGRSAWGACDIRLDQTGYLIQDGIAYLHPARFGLPEGQLYAAIVSDEAFLTADGRGGSEPFPHGGLFPEEVLIPWIEFTRDRELPQMEVALRGKGEEGKAGKATLNVTNLGSVSVTLVGLTVDELGTQLNLTEEIGALDKKSIEISLPIWPRRQDIQDLTMCLTYMLPDGQPGKNEFRPELETEALYERKDILDELGGL